MPVRRILLIRLHHLGDVLLTTPALRRLRQAYPEARIDYLTRGAGVDALAGNPCLDEVVPYCSGVRAELALFRTLRQRRFDVVIDFLSTPRSARVVWATGAPRRIGLRGRGPRNWLYTHLISAGRDLPLYAASRFLRMLEPLGVEPGTDLSLDIAVGPAERRWAAETWERLGLAGDAPVVAISAVARDPCKQWGLERWAAVADALIEAGARVLLTHGPGEEAQVERVALSMRHAAAWSYGATRLQRLAAVCERATLWAGNDGGAKHLAVAAGIPTVSVIRAGEGVVWTDTSPGSPHLYVEGVGPASDCRGGIDAIAPEEVIAVARRALEVAARSCHASKSRTTTEVVARGEQRAL